MRSSESTNQPLSSRRELGNGGWVKLLAAIVSMVVVAVMPVSMVMVPSPIAWGPAVIIASIPIPRAMDVIRTVGNSHRDVHLCVNGRYRHSAQTKQSGKKQH